MVLRRGSTPRSPLRRRGGTRASGQATQVLAGTYARLEPSEVRAEEIPGFESPLLLTTTRTGNMQ